MSHPVPPHPPSSQQRASGAPPQPQRPAADASQPARRGDPIGIGSVAAAGVALLLGAIGIVVQALVIRTGDPVSVGAASAAMSLVQLLVALAGLALGVVGVLRRDRTRIMAACGLGACAAIAIGTLMGFLAVPIFAALG